MKEDKSNKVFYKDLKQDFDKHFPIVLPDEFHFRIHRNKKNIFKATYEEKRLCYKIININDEKENCSYYMESGVISNIEQKQWIILKNKKDL